MKINANTRAKVKVQTLHVMRWLVGEGQRSLSEAACECVDMPKGKLRTNYRRIITLINCGALVTDNTGPFPVYRFRKPYVRRVK